MHEILEAGAIVVVGFLAGIVNTIVGGGSYIVLPLLVFVGLPPQVANGTNRFTICFQTLAAAGTFRKQGVGRIRNALPPALAAFAGGIPGAYLASTMQPHRFRSVMGWILLAGIVLLFVKRRGAPIPVAGGRPAPRKSIAGLAGAFVLGAYGGFLGAGVGVLTLIFLTPLLGLDLVRMVAVKVLMILFLSISASAIFIAHGQVSWRYSVPLIVANIAGGVVGARLAVLGGERWVRAAVAVIGALLALSLIFGFRPGE